jgi:hypothetical protein
VALSVGSAAWIITGDCCASALAFFISPRYAKATLDKGRTLNTYAQAISEQKRAANTIVVGILLNENASTEQPSANGS